MANNLSKTALKTLSNDNIADFSNIVPAKHREVNNEIIKKLPPKKAIFQISILNADISTYFDPSGLGRINLEYEGWAIANGANGTDNVLGRFLLNYSPGTYALQATDGSADAVVVSHKHDSVVFSGGVKAVNDTGTGATTTGFELGENSDGNGKVDETSTVGESGVGKNMPPYYVVLPLQEVLAP
jgi:hypothetical protein